MANAHWSKDMATLWWRDKGTGRKRITMHADPAKLKEKYERLWHADIEAALYSADGARMPLSVPDAAPAKAKRKPKARRPKADVTDEIAALVGA